VNNKKKQITKKRGERLVPGIEEREDGGVQINIDKEDELQKLYGVQTPDVAQGLMKSAMNSLGANAKSYRKMMAAMPAELEPRDAIEAMLVNQITATNAAISITSQRMLDSSSLPLFEGYERAMTKLSRTFLAQMDALKKYRAKAQQTVRVERVTVEDGGQAIVGPVTHGGGHEGKK
jgi:hypothetical protein